MKYKAENILFDFNGTIVNDLDLCINLLNEMLIKKNHAPVSRERYLEIFEFPVINYYIKAGFNLPEDNFDELAEYFVRKYAEGNPHCDLCKGVKDCLDYFCGKKNLYIVSASEINLLTNQLKIYGIEKYFKGVSGLDNINACSKVESAKAFIKNNNINPAECVFIGDTLHDKEVADALGIRCILVAQGHQSMARLRKGGCLVLSSLEELKEYIS